VFATLLGGLPQPPIDATVTLGDDAAIEAAVRAQEAAGLEPITDGRLRQPGLDASAIVEGWRRTAALTSRAVKQTLPGPYSTGRALDGSGRARDRATMAAADSVRVVVEALAAAGCPLVEIEEGEAHRIGEDAAERRRFRKAHRRLADGVGGTHLSLSIVGGSAHEAGAATILDPPYASLAVDLIAGPGNWHLVAVTPGDRGIVAGAMSGQPGRIEDPEILLWAAQYAASTEGRGLLRVGLGTAGGLADLEWADAVARLEALGHAARLASLPPGEELATSVDPRALDARSAAVGRRARPVPSPREGGGT
jgi:methionine synthase II (cobalamin-independent)